MAISWFCQWETKDGQSPALDEHDLQGLLALLRGCPRLVEGHVMTPVAAHDPHSLPVWEYMRQVFWGSGLALPEDTLDLNAIGACEFNFLTGKGTRNKRGVSGLKPVTLEKFDDELVHKLCP